MKNKLDYLFVMILFGFLISVPIGLLLSENPEVLFYENRQPAVFPPLEKESILNGSFINMVDNYIGDRTTYRNSLILLKTVIDMKLNRPVINDILVQDKLLLPYHGYSTWNTQYILDDSVRMAKKLAEVQKIIEGYGGKLYYLGLPQQYSYFCDEYPDYMDNRTWVIGKVHLAFSQALSEYNISFIDMMAIYKNLGSPAEYYSHSDHHYTYNGMLVAYQELMKQINEDNGLSLKIYSQDDLVYTSIINPFLGSLNRKIYGLWPSNEHIVVSSLKKPIKFTRYDNGEMVASSLYETPPPEKKATYSIYMGGDIGETIIQTERSELPSILIWGDSYSNALETIIWAPFNEMRSLDLRYYSEQTLTSYILEYKPDILVCIRDDTSFLDFSGNGNLSG